MKNVYTISNELNVSEETVRRWIRSGDLLAEKSGRTYVVSDTELDRFMRNNVDLTSIKMHNRIIKHKELNSNGNEEAIELMDEVMADLYASGNKELSRKLFKAMRLLNLTQG